MNYFLKSRKEIDECTRLMQERDLIESGISAKNWEAMHVIPHMKDGNWIDLGSDGGVILPNLVKKNITGLKVGIDLAYKENHSSDGVSYIKGDISRDVPFPDGFFNYITCLSVIEHNVDWEKLAYECSRLLARGGHIFLSFDFWTPKPDTSKTWLYSLSWTILDRKDVEELVLLFKENGLELTSEIDWTLQDAVINPSYCSPADCEYTFGILHFIKK